MTNYFSGESKFFILAQHINKISVITKELYTFDLTEKNCVARVVEKIIRQITFLVISLCSKNVIFKKFCQKRVRVISTLCIVTLCRQYVVKWKIYLHPKNISSNQLFSICKNVGFTKIFPKKLEGKFPQCSDKFTLTAKNFVKSTI